MSTTPPPVRRARSTPYEASVVAATFLALGARAAQRIVADREESSARRSGAGVVGVSGHGGRMDELVGDAQVAVQGRHLLIEFKADIAGMEDERRKSRRQQLPESVKDFAARAGLVKDDVRAAHAVIYGSECAEGHAIVVGSYASVMDLNGDPESSAPMQTLVEFCTLATRPERRSAYLTPVERRLRPRWGLSPSLFKQYVAVFTSTDVEAAGSTNDGGAARVANDDWRGYWMECPHDGVLRVQSFDSLSALAQAVATQDSPELQTACLPNVTPGLAAAGDVLDTTLSATTNPPPDPGDRPDDTPPPTASRGPRRGM